MAKIDFKGIDEYSKQLAELGVRAQGICKYAVYEGAAIVVETIKANTPSDSGDLRRSCSLAPMQDDNGYINTKVMWAGYDSNGTPNAIKAAVLEHGRSNKSKVPFIRPAVNSVRKAAEFAMEAALNKKLEQLMK